MFSFITKAKLSTMFSIVFAAVFITISLFFYTKDYISQKESLEANLHSKAESILDFADVLLESRNEKFFSGESPEIPQVIQNEIFDKFTVVSEGKVFYKEASAHPTNEKNLAVDYELTMIDYFKNNREVKQKKSIVTDLGKEFYMLSRPIISEQKCLMCHPTWKVDEVIAIEDVRIDMEDFNEVLESSLLSTIFTFVTNIVSILLLMHILFTKYIANRITKVLEIIFRVERGNFVIEDLMKEEKTEQGSSKNEIDRLFRHVEVMVDALKPVIKNVVSQSKEMAFEASYGYVKIDETNKFVEAQNRGLDKAQNNISNVVELNRAAGEKLLEIIESSNDSMLELSNGQKELTTNLHESKQASESMNNTVLSIEELRAFSNEIAKTIETIRDVADETNLISLNAAIEAARAGVHGRSFAVVAEKIRDLAEVSLNNAQEIRQVLTNIHQNIDLVSKNATEAKEVINLLSESSSRLDESFIRIRSSSDLIATTLNTFKGEFKEESVALQNTSGELEKVKESSIVLTKNADSSKEVMNVLVKKGGDLKSLADGFEIVTNARNVKRTIVTPPVKAKLFIASKFIEEVYIFDKSANGISFYSTNSRDESLKINLLGTLEFSQEVDGLSKVNFEIVYIGDEELRGIFFCGARIK